MTFPDFQRQMEWCQIIQKCPDILQKCPCKPIYRIYGYYATRSYLMCSKFRTPH